jgi:hypothetical protein
MGEEVLQQGTPAGRRTGDVTMDVSLRAMINRPPITTTSSFKFHFPVRSLTRYCLFRMLGAYLLTISSLPEFRNDDHRAITERDSSRHFRMDEGWKWQPSQCYEDLSEMASTCLHYNLPPHHDVLETAR